MFVCVALSFSFCFKKNEFQQELKKVLTSNNLYKSIFDNIEESIIIMRG